MKKFRGYLICTDCDGTLTDSEGNLSAENADAIRYFQEEGGLFTLATGRFPDHINLFKDQFQINAPIVSLNGTVLYDVYKQEVIHTWTMHKAECIEMLDYIHKNWPQVWEYWTNYSHRESIGYKPMEHKPGDGSLNKLFEGLPEELFKIVIVQPEEITPLIQSDLKKQFGDKFRFDTSWANGLEIQHLNSGKGVAVQYLKKYLDTHIHTTIGIGDYENDISLLEHADIGYAVANALESVKKAADRVTISNNENAIAAVIKELDQSLEERKKDTK